MTSNTNSHNRFKVFCLPFAGGSASIYYSWRSNACPNVDFIPVELSGRGARMAEPLYIDFSEAVTDVRDIVISKLTDSAFAIFGHSLGARLAFEVSYSLIKEGYVPIHLFVSGSAAPHVLQHRRAEISHLEDEAFKQEIIRMGGTPKEFFDYPELVNLFLPILRADFSISERYKFREKRTKLPCPIDVFYGKKEELDNEDLLSWGHHSECKVRLHEFSGDHFFMREHESEIITQICSQLNCRRN